MSFIAPILPLLRGRRPNLAQADRHRPGYFRDYYQRNIEKLRAYHAARARARRHNRTTHRGTT